LDDVLLFWVVLPNHVLFLFRAISEPMGRLVDMWKGYSAKEANKILGRRGPFWQRGYWDTYMRDASHETRTRRYIENNPVKSMLAASAKDWDWGSARHRDAHDRLCLPEL